VKSSVVGTTSGVAFVRLFSPWDSKGKLPVVTVLEVTFAVGYTDL